MKNLKFFGLFLLSLFFCLSDLNAQEILPWYQNEPRQPRQTNTKLKVLPLIKVQGNKFVNPQGETILFRGIAISDPDKVERQGHWNKTHFEKVKEMGANIVRIPVHPAAWRERTPEKYIKLLDEAVDWCTDLGMYVMIDWHTIGNLETEVFQDPMYVTTRQETFQFWRTISKHFSGNNTVAFYELFNEPTTYRGQLGPVSWADWKKTVETMITIVRAHDKETIPLVAGFDHFGFAASQYPVFATEFGNDSHDGTIDPNGNQYGTQIIEYLEKKGISWTIWVFDPEWGGAKIKNWNYELTAGGEFYKLAMQGKLPVQVKK